MKPTEHNGMSDKRAVRIGRNTWVGWCKLHKLQVTNLTTHWVEQSQKQSNNRNSQMLVILSPCFDIGPLDCMLIDVFVKLCPFVARSIQRILLLSDKI